MIQVINYIEFNYVHIYIYTHNSIHKECTRDRHIYNYSMLGTDLLWTLHSLQCRLGLGLWSRKLMETWSVLHIHVDKP